MAKAGKVLFHLTDDALIVANSGKPFTREGVIAVCHMHLGNKGEEKEEKPQDNYGSDLIRGIGKSVIGACRNDDNLALEQMKGEKALGGDYNGRSIWELLQNADDAATIAALGDEGAIGGLIGAKGLGFKSILEFSDSPEIYSGEFRFRFSREDTRKALVRGKVKITSAAPIFRIPHSCQPNTQCSALLKDGYATVICLPLVGDKAKIAAERLRELDESCLLLCQRLSRIEIKIGEESRVIEIVRNGNFGFENGNAIFTLKENGDIRKWRRWSAAWTPENNAGVKKLSAALCLPIKENRESETGKEHAVHVFFPTNQKVKIPGLKALIHASYELHSNRELLDNVQPHGAAIREKIGGLTSDILMDIPAAAALRVFSEIPPAKGNAGKDEIGRLQNVFSNAVAQTPFVPVIGGGKVKPAEVQIWNHRLGEVVRADDPDVCGAKLLAPSLSAERDVCNALKTKLQAKSVALLDHAKLLRKCRNDNLSACYAAWQVAGDIAREVSKDMASERISSAQKEEADAALKDVPIWWTNEGGPRPLNGDIPILFKRPKNWPKWLKADALTPKFREMLDSEQASKKQNDSPTRRDSLQKNGAWPLNSPHSYFMDALLPFCKGKDSKWWEKMGWDVLRWAFLWGGSEVSKLPPSIIGGGDKVNWIDEGIIHLPTNKGWLPAIHCYAGKAWGGPASFGKYFRNRKAQNRGVVTPMEEWEMPPNTECNKKKWESFLRGLGVSWGPKIRRVSLDDLPEELNDFVNKYHQQCLNKIKLRRNRGSASCVTECESAFIEHFPGALARCPSADVFRAMKSIEQLAQKTGETRLQYLYRQGITEDNHAESFAAFQLRQSKWVPCRPGLYDSVDGGDKLVRVRPEDAFMPECGLGKIVPVVIKPDGIPPNEWGRIYDALKDLGVRTEKPASTDKEWWRFQMNQLAKIAEELGTENEKMRWSLNNKNGEISNVMRRLYMAYGDSLSDMGNIPYISKTDKGEFIVFGPLRDVYWADKSHHEDADVRHSLLDSGFKLFPFFLRNGSFFGVKPLSDFVDEVPNPSESPDRTEEIQNRFKLRREMLALVAGKPISASEFAEKFAEKIKGCDKLTLILKHRDDEREIAEPQVDFYMDESKLLVNVGGNKWRALAAGIAAWCKVPEKAAVFEGLLREDENEEGYEECCKRLRQLGISEDELTPPPTDKPLNLPEPVIPPSNGGKPKTSNHEEQPPNTGEKEKHPNPGPRNGKGVRVNGPGGGGGGGGDPEIRHQIEYTAVNVVREYYRGKGYDVVSVEGDNVGWDLRASLSDRETLQVEVKGISRRKINVGLTPNEYGKSGDEMYRLAIVRDALSDNPACAIYKRDGCVWRLEEGDDENAPKQLVTEEKLAASVKEDKNADFATPR